MKILLVSPARLAPSEQKYATFSYGIFYIASVLEQNGHEVRIFDCNIDSRCPADFVEFHPSVIGFTMASGPKIADAIALSQEFKNVMPKAKIVWGGTHPSCLPEQTIIEPYIDFVVVGPGEYTMLELVEQLENNSKHLEDIKGLVFKRSGGGVVRNEPRPFIKNLDELPDPAWHLVDVSKYWAISLNTSRGCPYKCTYCYNSRFHQGYRADLSVDRILSQIEILQKRYGAKMIRFFEDNFTFNRKRLRQFCNEVIARKMRFTWDCEARADLTESEIALMAKAGCVSVGLGVETGSSRMLSFLKKGMDLEQMEKSFWFFVKHKISPRLYIMHALPTENIDDFVATHKMMARLDHPPFIFMPYVPFPGAPLADYCNENGLAKAPTSLAEWSTYFPTAGIRFNLSELPDELLTEVMNNFGQTYTTRRLRFALRHRPGFLVDGIIHPLEFIKTLRELFRCSLAYLNGKNNARRMLMFDVLKSPTVITCLRNEKVNKRKVVELPEGQLIQVQNNNFTDVEDGPLETTKSKQGVHV